MAVVDQFETVACVACGSPDARTAWIRPPRDDHAQDLLLPGGRSRWVVCERCGLVYQSPRPGPEAVTRLYAGGTYHQQRGGQPEHYVAYSLRRSRAALDWAFEQDVMRDRVGRALDIGSGIGGALVGLRERGRDVVGIEPDADLVALGQERFNLDLRVGFLDAEALPDEEFDLAFSCHVWEHLADPLESLPTCTPVAPSHEWLALYRGAHLSPGTYLGMGMLHRSAHLHVHAHLSGEPAQEGRI